MELSNDVRVDERGIHLYFYDSRLREELFTPIYGVHQSTWPTRMWIWNTTKGPPKSVTDEWLRTEDGMDFLDFMERRKRDFDSMDFDPDEEDKLS